jgi:hypothetical protein
MIGRLDDIASHKMKEKNKTATNDVYLPIDEIIFHKEKASG